ncbi:HAD family hydrolase [Roseicyclus persicicus]|uniref:phosphoglycolate phosphatase n=1 Tax=Roseicyclus persicicus TaxID=2650661 RepID=A0A7X6JYE1_9RHOB|nr:HAD family hydrolase [Roseibacterium persicicum]NKX43708.1 HAD family hydrolase [Roseibacterium persicicum]
MQPRHAPAGLLFDKDGTLFDFQRSWGGWARDVISDLAGGDPGLAARLADALGYDAGNLVFLPGSLSIAGTVREQAEAIAPHLPGRGVAALEARLVAAAGRAPMIPAVPLRPLLAAWRAQGLSLGIATNDAEVAARQQLEATEIIDVFHFIAGYDSGFGAKPGPGMCLAFAEARGLDPSDCVMVGDSRHDLEAGRAAGMRVVGVLTGPAGVDDLAPLADAVLPDIGALPAWLAAAG